LNAPQKKKGEPPMPPSVRWPGGKRDVAVIDQVMARTRLGSPKKKKG